MSSDRQRNCLGLHATRCGSLWIVYIFFSPHSSVAAFSYPPSARRGVRETRQARIPSMLLAKDGKDYDKVTPLKQNKRPTRKLLEEDLRKNAGRTSKKSAMLFQAEFLGHDILSPEEEKVLGKKIGKAVELKEKMRGMIEEKEAIEFERFLKQEEYTRLLGDDDYFDIGMGSDEEDEFSSLFSHGLDGSFLEETRRQKNQMVSNIQILPVDQYLDDAWATKASSESTIFGDGTTRQNLLSAEDLEYLGGREYVSQILLEGAIAREQMISSNIRLVLSIAKKWCKKSIKRNGASDNLAAIYGGSWTRPSLDEAVQEGIIGLATAADRFDYKRNLRFSTYATYWIVNFVRRCFQNAATGGFRVPQVRSATAEFWCGYFVNLSHDGR
jgi:hypothetical protein